MALHLNLLHEEIPSSGNASAIRLRSASLALRSCGAVLFLYYGWNAYQTLEIKARLGAVQRDWAKIEPQ